MSYCFATVTRCNDANNGKCGNRKCIQKELGVMCSCDIYSDSEVLTTLASGIYVSLCKYLTRITL